jgi:hypothetical protein
MKKNIVTILFVYFSFVAFAGSSNYEIAKDGLYANLSGAVGDSIDIKRMVDAQIESVRNKQIQDSIAFLKDKNIQSASVKAVVLSHEAITLKPQSQKTQWDTFFSYIKPIMQHVGTPNEMTIKLSIMGGASFFASLLVYVRRKKLNTKKITKSDFKNGIKLIREEKVKDKKYDKLSLIRNKLIGSTPAFQLSNDSVAKNARELKIAKGEIYLAARIKLQELKKVSY